MDDDTFRSMLEEFNDVPRIDINISQLIRCARACSHVSDFHDENKQFTKTFIKDLDIINLCSEMVYLLDKVIFTKPFDHDEPTNRSSASVKQHGDDIVYCNPDVISAAGKMRSVYLQTKECLVHGDWHTESIMVHGDDSKMIDLEFAYMGPPSFDVGVLIANYILAHYGHMNNPEVQRRPLDNSMIDMCKLTVTTYLEHMTCYHGNRDKYRNNLLSEMAGFAGCEIIRRILGIAHVSDIENNDKASIEALEAGVRLLLGYDRIHCIDRLLTVAIGLE